ncbi:Abi-like protein [Streptococcus macacae NCTC 11558]|uniref:Abi-like protein n=2 Tax=Streptococcus macacae TaxID=1339 RepID=G5JXN9_9STRE|nr:Abi-like protein [Streptococcus macacae NCTC 11558]
MDDGMEIKEFKTFEEQVAKLVEHGCENITSEEYAINILKRINYYRLTAYFLPFRDEKTQKYNNNKISLEKVYSLYQFDSELRLLLMEYLEDIELYFRTQIAYHHANQYGALAYKNSQNFNKFHKHEEFMENLEKELSYRRKDPVYKHHQLKYDGEFPLWVLVEFFSFGMTSKFYADSLNDIQSIIAQDLKLKTTQVRTYLEVAVVLRNYCAHYGRLYYRSFTKIPRQLPSFMTENIKIKNRLMAQLYAIKQLYGDNEKWNKDFILRLRALFTKYQSSIRLYHLGFTNDWEVVLKK